MLIEQAELDRHQQRQILEHSPELQAMARMLNNMRDIMANRKLTAKERLNSISYMHIRFEKLMKETGVLSGALSARHALEPPSAATQMQLTLLAEKGIGPEKEPEEKEKKQYEDILDEKDKSAQASALSPQMAKVIRWNIPGLYQHKSHRLLKNITEQPDILTWNENGEAVVYGDAVPVSNFKSLFKLMVSNKQDLHQVGIDDFLRALQSWGVKKDEISGEPLKFKYKNVAPYGGVQRHSTSVEYEHGNVDEEEDIEKEEVRRPSPKQPS